MTPLGTFQVAAASGEVAAFRAATGLPEGNVIPATFPMRWLAASEIRDALFALAPDPDLVPVHESQSFEYTAPLAIGERYAMGVGGRREVAPDRLVLEATIASGDGTILARLETVLRLFSIETAAA